MHNQYRIVHLIPSLRRGGMERQLATIYKYSNKNVYPTKIVYFEDAPDDYISEYHLSKDTYKINAKTSLHRFVKLYKFVRDYRPHLIYSWANTEAIYGLVVGKLLKIPFINGSIRHGIRLRTKRHLFRMFVLKLSPCVVSNSHAGLKANRIKKGYVLHNGIDDKFAFRIPKEMKMRRREILLGPGFNDILFLSISNFTPSKDYHTVFVALKNLHEKGYKFNYIIVGDGPLRSKIQQAIDKFDLQKCIMTLGRIQNVSDYLSISDIFLHSSRGEGCSNAILEAMSHGLPVIASNTGGTTEIVGPNQALLFEYRNPSDLEEKIEVLLDNYAMIERLGNESFELAIKKFSASVMIQNYYDLVEVTVTAYQARMD